MATIGNIFRLQYGYGENRFRSGFILSWSSVIILSNFSSDSSTVSSNTKESILIEGPTVFALNKIASTLVLQSNIVETTRGYDLVKILTSHRDLDVISDTGILGDEAVSG